MIYSIKNIEINITTGILKLISQKKLISEVAEKIERFIARSAKYINAGINSRNRIKEKL